MFLFKRAIGRKNLQRAAELLATARLLPQTSLESLVQLYPGLHCLAASGLLPLWDELVCVAAVGTAFQAIPDNFPESDWKGMGNAIKYQLNRWKPGSFDVLLAFCDYCGKLLAETDLEMEVIVGGWVWVNLARSPQANAEVKQLAVSLPYARVLGFLIQDIFYRWWEENHAREFCIQKITPRYLKSFAAAGAAPGLAPARPR